jgi:dCMP deaminase
MADNNKNDLPFKDWPRPSWDTYFMALAFVTAMRSPDESTKHGCIIIDNEENKTLVSQGYNGYARGVNHKIVPKTRPEKYSWVIHAEKNAILNAGRNGVPLKGSVLYVTGHPCIECAKAIVQSGIKKVIYGPINSNIVPEKDIKIIRQIIKPTGIIFQKYSSEGWRKALQLVQKYADTKLELDKKQKSN